MAHTQVYPFVTTNQPQYQAQYEEQQQQPRHHLRHQRKDRPFRDFNNECSVGFCNCCNDVSQCESYHRKE